MTTSGEPAAPEQKSAPAILDLGRSLRAFGDRILSLSWPRFVGLSLVITFLRTGVWLSDDKAPWADAARQFPHHAKYYYESWLYLGVPHVLHLTTLDRFVGFYIVVAIVTIVLLYAVPDAKLGRTRSRLFILAVLASGIPPTISYEIGFYDQVAVLGALLVAMTSRRWLVVLGALILAGANPSQAVVASIALGIVTLAPGFRQLREKAALCFAVACVEFAIVDVLLSHAGVGSRETQIGPDIHNSLKGFATAGGVTISSWYGAAWFLVIALIFACPTPRGRLALATALAFIPAIASITTLDGTRVFVTVAALPFLCCAWEWAASRIELPEVSALWVGLLAIATLVVPALYYRGDVITLWLPWQWLVGGGHFT